MHMLYCTDPERIAPGVRRRELKPELFSLAVERARVDPEDLGGGVEARRTRQDPADVLDFERFEGDRPARLDRAGARGRPPRQGDPFGEVRQADGGAGGEDRGALDRVAQLAEVAGPGM